MYTVRCSQPAEASPAGFLAANYTACARPPVAMRDESTMFRLITNITLLHFSQRDVFKKSILSPLVFDPSCRLSSSPRLLSALHISTLATRNHAFRINELSSAMSFLSFLCLFQIYKPSAKCSTLVLGFTGLLRSHNDPIEPNRSSHWPYSFAVDRRREVDMSA